MVDCFKPPVVYAIDLLKAMVLFIFLILFGCVVFTTGRFMLSYFALCSRVVVFFFSVLLSIVITSLVEEREQVYVFLLP